MLWFTEVDTSKVWWLANAWRFIWVTLDRVVYGILGLVYQIFFNIASANIFSGNSIARISQRIQLIIGVFVLFQLVMTIIRGIINPDSFTDSKTGAGNVIMRICTALIMLALLVPINFASTANEYQEKVSQNGILFGTLYSLQYRILNNNTIGQIITGVDPQENESNDEYFERTNEAKLTESANNFVVSILRGFYRINLREGELEERDGYEPGMIAANRMCPDGKSFTDYIKKYASTKATPGDIFSGYDASCKVDGNKRYVFTYMPLASLIVGILFVVIMLSFCFDIAMRSIKLGILQIIAPIPIISYMDPKGGKDGAFNAWVKLLISTYIDLFIRIATVYFAIFIIQEMLVSGIEMAQGGIVGVLTKILIYIALFYFAKEAPKFIKQALGMKDDGGGLFSGLGKIATPFVAGAGVVGSARTNWKSTMDEQSVINPGHTKRNIGKGLASAVAGGVAGGAVGVKAALGKDGSVSKVLEAQNARNARRASHSTLLGRAQDSAYSVFTGKSLAEAGNKKVEATEKAGELIGKLKSKTTEEGLKNGTYGIVKSGDKEYMFNATKFEEAYNTADSKGNFEFGGIKYNRGQFGPNFIEDLKKSQVQRWMDLGKEATIDGGKTYSQLQGEDFAPMITDLKDQLSTADKSVQEAFDMSKLSSYGKAIGASAQYVSDTKAGSTPEGMKQTMRNANKKGK